MKPAAFLDLADDLAVGDNEAAWRTAVSRAYYAAFHAARDFIRKCGFEPPFADRAHAYLIHRLMQSGDAQLDFVGRELSDLRSRRNEADYEIDTEFAQRRASNLVYRATDVVRILEDYAAEPALWPGIVAAIQAYERDVLREVTYRGPAP
jgi:uncharacterized protein (UPF0332 family)